MSSYNAPSIEEKWQKKWEKEKIYNVNLNEKKKKKFYNLIMFPYPSGDKLHVGHWYNYAPADSYARYMKMHGYNVLSPIGFDSFGLPAENYAIKTGVHPKISIAKNIENMTTQLKKMGTMYDWDKAVITSNPDYYKWTQWIFLQLYKNGLAYKKNAPVNWCPSCKTVLANEQVQDGKCERDGSLVVKKDLNQWFFKLSSYAEKLLNYEGLDWPEKTITMQKNWIGKSTGSEIVFKTENGHEDIIVYTTRIDTLHGCTYIVLAPEHPLVFGLTKLAHLENVTQYIEKSRNESDIDRMAEGRKKTGVFTGTYAINPINGKKVPVWIADYVLVHYGTGAVMAVPSHDDRDFEFAKKYELEIIPVIIDQKGKDADDMNKYFEEKGAFTGYGYLINSEEYNGLSSDEAKTAITLALNKKKLGYFRTNYKLRDWLLSRQRYWGAPIPVVYCKKCGEVAVSEKDLPIKLPDIKDFTPGNDGKSPLSKSDKFRICKCPKCGAKAERETDTMDTFVCSSWYYLRYLSNKLKTKAFDKKIIDKWMPVDMYIGGPEHACMHLIYARFLNMVMHDLGFVSAKEPFKRLIHQGMITKNGAKMSKSKGNVVSPDSFVAKYGSDVFRMYLMFMGPFEDGGDWNDLGITGISRFVDRFYNLIINKGAEKVIDEKELAKNLNKLIKKATEDFEKFHFNTAVSAMMEFVNFSIKNGIDRESKKIIVKLIAPIAPHLAEECFDSLGGKKSVFNEKWPVFDEKLTIDETVKIGVQVNGKLRGEILIDKNATKEAAFKLARENENVKKHLTGVVVLKEIYVEGRIVGFVVK